MKLRYYDAPYWDPSLHSGLKLKYLVFVWGVHGEWYVNTGKDSAHCTVHINIPVTYMAVCVLVPCKSD